MSATKEQGSFITDQNGIVWTVGKAKASIETEILAGPPHLPDAAKAMVLLDALTAAEAERDALRAQVEQLKADRAAIMRECAPKWISVKEQLPKIGQTVDVWDVYNGRIPYVTYEDVNKWVSVDYAWSGELTHWMTIPESPAIEGKEE